MNWTCEQIPAAPDRESILHTATAADGVAWAFGISPNQQGWFDTLAFRRDTHGWRPVTVPSIGRANRAIAISAGDVWAVGDNNTSLHYNGADWRQTPTAALGAVQAQLFGLAQFGGHDVWAAGYAPDPHHDRGRGTVQHWDGHAWTDQPLPSVATNWGLSGIGGTATDDLWAVGTVMQHPARAITLHYDGHTWQPVPTPTPPHMAAHLGDVVALASDDVWAAGHLTSAERGHQPRRPFAMHWDGARWSARDLDDPEGQISQLVTDGGRVVGIGYAGAAPYVTALTGSSLPALPGPTPPSTAVRSSLHGATILPGGALLAVGATASPRMPLQPLTAVMHP